VSRPLRILAPAKINLVLEVLGSRSDGFHEVRTVLQTIDLQDEIEVGPADELRFDCDDPDVPAGEDNLVVRAARALAAAAGREPAAAIRLRKVIPPASGLGGGSSDAAATLLALASLWGLGETDLHEVAASLGSDVPFFLRGGTALGLGRGELILPLPDLTPVFVTLARPAHGLSTADVYKRLPRRLTAEPDGSSMKRFARHLRRGGRVYSFVRNDLEPAAGALLPEVRTLVRALREGGALAATVSGSGSAVFGLFAEEAEARLAREAIVREEAAVRTWVCRTLDAEACHGDRRHLARGATHGDH
jgi:4-diphosphocytidyl-2-C-methyl-D-erythritol kinase